MKKKIAAALAVTFALGVTSAFAANPFVDVPAKHWAYDAVSKLAQAGIVDGYGDGTFRGDKNITRYEMAQIVAKALAKEDKANAEQKALLNKLSAEFSAELDNLGVRVTKLEKNQANLKFGGTLDVRYTATDNDAAVATGTDTKGEYRLRMEGVAKVDDKTTFGLRVTTKALRAGDDYKRLGTYTAFGSNDGTDNISLDRVFVARQFGDVKATIGSQAMKVGASGLIVDSAAYSFSGVKLEGQVGVVNLATNWGRVMSQADIASVEASAKTGKLAYGAGYAQFEDNAAGKDAFAKYVYGNATYTFNNKFSLGGEYVQNREASTGDTAYVAVAVLGDQVLAKKGQNNLTVKYYEAGTNSIGYTVLDVTRSASPAWGIDTTKLEGVSAQYNYAFSNNFITYGQFVKVDDKENVGAAKRGFEFYRIGVTAKF